MEDSDREKYVKEKVVYESKKEYYDRGVLTVSIADIKANSESFMAKKGDRQGWCAAATDDSAGDADAPLSARRRELPFPQPSKAWVLGRDGLMTKKQAEAGCCKDDESGDGRCGGEAL